MGQAEQLEHPGSSLGVYLRLLAAVGALAAGAGAVIFVLSLLRALPPVAASATSSGTSSTASATTSSATPSTPVPVRTSGFPSPPRGSVVFGAQAGVNALGLAVLPQGKQLLLQASVVNQNGHGVKGLAVGFDVRATNGAKATPHATVCGPGCYRATVAVARPASVAIVLPHRSVPFTMPAQWPAPSAATLVENATRVYKGLHSFVIRDTLGDGQASLFTIYRILAPDKLTYTITGGGDAVIIGDQRWDRPTGSKRWLTQAQSPITQPTPFWVSAVDAHLLGTVSVHGRPAWKVSFFDPNTPGWYTLLIDKATLHTLEMVMTAHAHFMHDTYSAFDAPMSIVPPTG